MKKILVTQRYTPIQAYDEVRDSLDQRWFKFFEACDLVPILMPNLPTIAHKIMTKIEWDGVLLTGGNNLSCFDPSSLERDRVEKMLLEDCIANNKPLIGVCRGMQFIQHHFGVPLEKVCNHAARVNKINFQDNQRDVTCYHDFGTTKTVDDLVVLGKSEDSIVESIKHQMLPIYGIMWHPERENNFHEEDVDFFREALG
jgi:putative glutamine amidotransferase